MSQWRNIGALYLIAAGFVGTGAALWLAIAAGVDYAFSAPWWAAHAAAWAVVAAAFAGAIEIIGGYDDD